MASDDGKANEQVKQGGEECRGWREHSQVKKGAVVF